MTSVTQLDDAKRLQKRARMSGAHVPDDDGDGPDGSRRVIQIKAAEQPRVVDETEAALIDMGAPIYVRAGRLVQPILEEALASGGRATVVGRIKELCSASLTDLLGRAVTFKRYSEQRQTWIKTDPPRWVAEHLLARAGMWKFPRLSGVITTPTLRPDGSLLEAAGYDEATGLFVLLDPGFRLPKLPLRPTRADAERALELLTDIVSGFPFVGPADRSVALSGILTTVLRPALPVVPLHAIRAHSPGTGKSFLVDLFSAIAAGRPCPVITAGKTEEETEKRLGAMLLSGAPLISIDNANGELGGDMLCQMTERPLVRIRVLGRSESPEIECRSMPFATGNKLTLVGDMTRRAVLCSLDAQVERPELRNFEFDPVARAMADRGQYVAAALTILLAYRAAGSPRVCGPLGSYGAWSETVRSALIWLGEADPTASMETARAEDPNLAQQRELFEHWQESLTEGRFYSVSEVVAIACETDPFDQQYRRPLFRDLLMVRTGARAATPSTVSIGKWFKTLSGQVMAGHRLVDHPDEKRGNRYAVMRLHVTDDDDVS